MATSLSADGMRDLVARHSDHELAHEWEGALATMGSEPFYEFFPFRLRISGPEAITTMWDRLFVSVGPIRCFDLTHIDVSSAQITECVGEDSLVHIMAAAFIEESGERVGNNQVVVYAFEGDRMRSETLYVDSVVARYLDPVFDAGFRSLPGVQEF